MIWNSLIVEVAYASNKRMVPSRLRPIDCLLLGWGCSENIISMIFDYIVVDGRSFPVTLGTGFYIYVCHLFLLDILNQ